MPRASGERNSASVPRPPAPGVAAAGRGAAGGAPQAGGGILAHTFKVGQMAKLVRVSVRTLHHYHEVGLLSPSGRSESGHRLYAPEDLERLQHVPFYRELGFPLEEVRSLMAESGFDRREALLEQRGMLQEQIGRLEALRGHRRQRRPSRDLKARRSLSSGASEPGVARHALVALRADTVTELGLGMLSDIQFHLLPIPFVIADVLAVATNRYQATHDAYPTPS